MRLPADAVLMVIDAEEATGPRHAASHAPEAEKNIAALVAAWRAEGLPLVHVGRRSTAPAVPPLDGEIVIARDATSAFVASDLETMLDALGATTLVVCGALATHALEASARHAADSGRRRMYAPCRSRFCAARRRPSSTPRRRFGPPRPPRRASAAGRDGPDRAVRIQLSAEVFSFARAAIFSGT
jgi:Isochorismatase family